MFVDRVKVHLRAGNGGAGVSSFERLKGRPRGKPDGGSGGRGGDVVVEADPSIATLLEYRHRPHRRAESGTHGQGDLRNGRNGADLVVSVPPGTVVRDQQGAVLADLVEAGQRVRVLQGGRGGRGNAAFVGPRHRAPSFAEQGEFGEEGWFVFELKLIADAALVGFPNAGKSTLISRVSAAKPKIADYPFTTLEPHLGVVSIDEREFVLADVPGLIEGAAEGRGLGHEFLRHVERAHVLAVLVDPTDLQPLDAVDQYRVLLDELQRHSPELTSRPRVVVVNKIDVPAAREAAAGIVRALADETVLPISAVTGEGVPALLHRIADLVAEAERRTADRRGFILHRPVAPSFTIRREGDQWVVEGRSAERAVALADLTAPEAADFAARRLDRLGVDEALRAAGAQPGDEVRIADLVFVYHDADEEEDSLEDPE